MILAVACLAACGGQTGEGDDPGNRCVDQPAEPIGDSERSRLGFSADEILAFAGEQRFELLLAGTSTPRPATTRLQLHSGSVRFIPTRPLRDLGMPGQCRGRIEADVELELTVSTPSGDVHLVAAGELTADTPHRARLSVQLSAADFDALRTFELGPEESFDGLELRALLTPGGSAGELTARIAFLVRVGPQPEPEGDAPRARDYMTAREAEVGHWPVESDCAPGELPLAPDQALFDIAPEQVIQRIVEPRTLRWDDGSTTTLRLEVANLGSTCMADLDPEWLQPIDWPPIPPEDPALFGVELNLAIATDDGRFRSDAVVVLQYRARKTGGLDHAWFQHFVQLAPGDPGGWAGDAADHSVQRATLLQLRVPHVAGSSWLVLLGQPPASACSSTTVMCTATPPVAPTLIRGTIE